MNTLHSLSVTLGSRKRRKLLGRGTSSGKGKTSGKGHKGQNARKSGGVRPGFEGGQTPFYKRIPKVGLRYQNLRPKPYRIINLSTLLKLDEAKVSLLLLQQRRLVNRGECIKVLANGLIDRVFHLETHFISKRALNKIELAGGSVTIINNSSPLAKK
jgi:large subunit ribosomal protein L15